ncbi:MAG: hypothetical protein GQ564_04000, partial [Bacteroidales bacterium]|nr:hypothetical protein [Bacteroidales bacterium]
GTQTGGTADGNDYETLSAIISPYTTEAEFKIIFLEDWTGEANETLELEIAMTSLASMYLIAPTSPRSVDVSLTIANVLDDVVIHTDMGEIAKDGDVEIYFDGAVTYVAGKTITFHDEYYSTQSPDQVIIAAEDVMFDGNHVIIAHADFWEWTNITMTIEAGAFVDAQGNVNEETEIEFEIPFNINSYAGSFDNIYTDTIGGTPYDLDTVSVDVVVISEEDYTIGVFEVGEWIDQLELTFVLATSGLDLAPVKTELYLNWYTEYGYYLEDASWFSDPALTESSQINIRDLGASQNSFDDVTFDFEFMYEVYGDLVKGDGSAGTSGQLEAYINTYSHAVSGKSKATLSGEKTFSKIKIIGEEMVNGHKAIKVELVK